MYFAAVNLPSSMHMQHRGGLIWGRGTGGAHAGKGLHVKGGAKGVDRG